MSVAGEKRPFRKTLSHKIENAPQWSDLGVCSHKALLASTRVPSNSRYLTTHLPKQIDRVLRKASPNPATLRHAM